MLFHSSIRKELARSFGATLIVLATVVVTMTLIRTLGQATRGNFAPEDVMLAMGYAVLSDMPTILALSLFIAIIATLSRMYRDSEMVIWFASGKGLLALLRPLLRFASPVLLVVMVLALWVLPWSKQQLDDMQEQYEKRGDIERLEPGQFQESANGQRVFFIEKDASGKIAGSNVFIASSEDGKDTITSARSGRIETVGTDRFLVLQNGQRLDRMTEESGLKISEFAEYRVRVGEDILGNQTSTSVHARPTWGLIQGGAPADLAQLSWRIGLILAAINFTVIGLAVSSVNPRVGRSYHLALALFCFVSYYNMVNVGQNWIASGRTTMPTFMLSLHGGAFVLALSWLLIRHFNLSWRNLWSMPQRSAFEVKV